MAPKNDTQSTDFAETLERAYSEFHADPRAISYWEIDAAYDPASLAEADMVADTIDLACRDAAADREPRDVTEILDTLAGWTDE